jgi:aspartate racemase
VKIGEEPVKTVGLIGGIGPESTVDYYRAIIAAYRERQSDGSYPSIVINSIDAKRMLDAFAANELAAVTAFLAAEVERLAAAGVSVGLLAANTPHIVFDEVQRQSPIPLVSIVEATCEAVQALGLARPGLLGTRFTMQGRFYPEVFAKAGIALVVPDPDEQAYIHDKYMNELVRGLLIPETRERLLAIIDRMKTRDGIDGVILGGTELPLILRADSASGIPLLDTTQIHAKALVVRACA